MKLGEIRFKEQETRINRIQRTRNHEKQDFKNMKPLETGSKEQETRKNRIQGSETRRNRKITKMKEKKQDSTNHRKTKLRINLVRFTYKINELHHIRNEFYYKMNGPK